jgi:hypothetical protein
LTVSLAFAQEAPRGAQEPGRGAQESGRGAPDAGRGAPEPTRSAEALARFPQPVLVGALAGRQVLENRPNQRVLGRVEAVARDADGSLHLVLERSRWPWQRRRCAVVPIPALALLGQFVVVMDLDDAQFAALPDRCQAPGAVLPPDTTIRVGLTKS